MFSKFKSSKFEVLNECKFLWICWLIWPSLDLKLLSYSFCINSYPYCTRSSISSSSWSSSSCFHMITINFKSYYRLLSPYFLNIIHNILHTLYMYNVSICNIMEWFINLITIYKNSYYKVPVFRWEDNSNCYKNPKN